jgi:hypothetical protein
MKCNDDGVDTDPTFQFFLLIFVKLLMVLEKINEDEKSVELVLCDGSEFVDQRVILNSRLQYSTHSNVEMRLMMLCCALLLGCTTYTIADVREMRERKKRRKRSKQLLQRAKECARDLNG